MLQGMRKAVSSQPHRHTEGGILGPSTYWTTLHLQEGVQTPLLPHCVHPHGRAGVLVAAPAFPAHSSASVWCGRGWLQGALCLLPSNQTREQAQKTERNMRGEVAGYRIRIGDCSERVKSVGRRNVMQGRRVGVRGGEQLSQRHPEIFSRCATTLPVISTPSDFGT